MSYPFLARLNCWICLILLCTLGNLASSQIITTIAGNGTGGYSGDGGPAVDAELSGPWGIATDAEGNIYFAEEGNNRVRKINQATGIITTVAGGGVCIFPYGDGGPADSACLNGPTGVAVDASGNIYIADRGNNVIRKVDALTGIISTFAGIIAPLGGFSGDGGPADSAMLNTPQSVTVDNYYNIYICDYSNARVRKVNVTTGIITTVAGNGGFGYTGDGGPADSAQIDIPWGVAVDDSNNIYIADDFDYVVRKVDATTGIITTYAGNGREGYTGNGGPADSASITAVDVAVDACNNVYIASAGGGGFGGVVRRVDAITQIISTAAGNGIYGYGGNGGLAINAEMEIPLSVILDRIGNMYISDGEASVIRKVTDTNICCLPLVTIEANADTICPQSLVTFKAAVTNGGNAPSYQWKINGMNVGANTDTFSYDNFIKSAIVNCFVTGNAACNPGAVAYSNNIIINVLQPGYIPEISVNDSIICPGDTALICAQSGFKSYLWNTGDTSICINATVAGLYSFIVTANGGCADTSKSIGITTYPSAPVTYLYDTICSNNTFSFNGNNLNTTGIYETQLTNINGCDSLVVLALTVKALDTTIITQSICFGDTLYFDNSAYTQTGNYTKTYTGSNGCDSLVTLALTIITPDTVSIVQRICYGDTAYIGNTAYTQSGNYYNTLTGALGCDSLVLLALTVNLADTVSLTQSICTGDTIYIGNNAYTHSGNYSNTLTNVLGCDSLVILALNVIPADTVNITKEICDGDTVYVGHSVYTKPGNYTDTLTGVLGCDSLVILSLSVNPLPVVTLSWDTMLASGRFQLWAGDTVDCVLNTFPQLAGGQPSGGTYSGREVFNNILYIDSPVSALFSGADTIIYTFIDDNECSASAYDMVYIDICEGLQEIAGNSITIYPNPATEQIFIKTGDIQPETLKIYDVNGRVIAAFRYTNVVAIDGLSSGVYFIEIKSLSGVARKCFVKM